MKRFRRLTFAVFSLALTGTAQAAEGPSTYVKCGRLFDGTSDARREGMAIVVRDGVVADVGPGLPVPEGATVLDLGRFTVAPGLIDAHTHVALHPGDYDGQILRETPELRAIHATLSARATLEAGVTTIRDLGNEGAGFADLAVRDAVAKGLVPGPRVLAAIQPVTATGAYGLVGYSPYVKLPPIAYEADGPVGARAQVRRLVREGADVVKVYMESYEKRQAESDVLSGARTYSDEELRALPTLLVYELWRDGKIFAGSSPVTLDKVRRTVDRHAESFRAALRTPVSVVMGSDTFELPGANAQELVAMVRTGMSPLEALRSATSRAAVLLGLEGRVGVVRKGAAADLVAFEGDPLTDIEAVTRPVLVMKGGKVALDRRATR